MTRKEAETVLKVLQRIKQQDYHVQLAVIIVEKQLRQFNDRRGQLKDQYDYDNERPW
jgi:hypothetical protein